MKTVTHNYDIQREIDGCTLTEAVSNLQKLKTRLKKEGIWVSYFNYNSSERRPAEHISLTQESIDSAIIEIGTHSDYGSDCDYAHVYLEIQRSMTSWEIEEDIKRQKQKEIDQANREEQILKQAEDIMKRRAQ